MTPSICVRWIRSTFPPLIAEILPDTCWFWETPAGRLIQKPSIDDRMLAGLKDSILLLREALAGSADTRRTSTVTRKHLTNAVDALAVLLDPVPANALGWAFGFAELRDRAQNLDDIAQALQQEEGNAQVSELCVWAAAARACVESHARDVEILIPWSRLPSNEIAAMSENIPERGRVWAAIEPHFRTLPTLAEAPERFEAALKELSHSPRAIAT